jgi:hypothetical protein
LAARPRGPFARLVTAQRAQTFVVCPAHVGLSTPCTSKNCRYLDRGNSAP